MFANLKKKIEEEVGDLGRLTSPINLVGALGDRRVGGSTQGTNTPSNLGSRQSSVASLVSIDTPDRPSQPRHQTPSANQTSKDTTMISGDELHTLRKQNADLRTKLDVLKKSFEDRLQNQETDFAWKYNTKEDELAQVKNERDKMKDKLKTSENGWQEKYMRVATELENLEGLSKQENAKVKHLLLNTQNDLQAALRRIAELESEVKNRQDQKTASLMMVTGLDPPRAQTEEPELIAFETSEDNREAALQTRITELEHENTGLKQELENKKGHVSTLETKLKDSEESFTRTIKEKESLAAQLNNLQDEMEELKNKNDAYHNECERREEKSRNAEVSISHLKAVIDEKNSEIQKFYDEKSDLLNQVKKYKDIVKNNETEISVLARDQADRSEQLANLQNELDTYRKAHDTACAESENLRAEVAALSAKENARISNEEVHETEQVNFLTAKLAESKIIEENLRKENELLQTNLQQLEERHTRLTCDLRQQSEVIQEVKSLKEQLSNATGALEASSNDYLKLQERLKIAELAEGTVNSFQEAVKILLDQYQVKVPEIGGKLASSGSLVEDLQAFGLVVLEQAGATKKLEEEMKKLKEDANTEVASLQFKTEQLVSKSLHELKETKANLIIQVEQNKQLTEENRKQAADIEKLQKRIEVSEKQMSKLQAENESSGQEIESKDVEINKLRKTLLALREEMQEHLQTKEDSLAKVQELQDELQESLTRAKYLEAESEKAKEELRNYASQTEKASEGLSSFKTQLEQERKQHQHEITQLTKRLTEFEKQVEDADREIKNYQAEIVDLRVQIDNFSVLCLRKDEDIRLLEVQVGELKCDILDKEKVVMSLKEENLAKVQELSELQVEVERINTCDKDLQSKAESTIKSLQADLDRQEAVYSEECSKVLALRREADKLGEQVVGLKSTVTTLQDEKDALQTQLEELSVLKSLAEEEAQASSDKCSEMYNEITELKKSLRTSRQQLSELKKTVTRENKTDAIVSLPNSSVAGLAAHFIEENGSKEVCQNSDGGAYSEVNFLYLRSVLFKYLTASDPQVAASLIKVVATLLELKPEEEKLLKDTQENQSRWFSAFGKK